MYLYAYMHNKGITCTCSDTTGIHIGPYYYDDILTNSVDCNIQKIYLMQLGLQGTIPKSFGNLTHLTHVHLARNSIGGTIPSEVGLLTKVTFRFITNCYYLVIFIIF